MKKPETLLSEKILSRLRAEGGWWFKVHGGPFQITGIPDILGCWYGHFVGIELKVEGGKPSKKQLRTLSLLRAAGARAGIAYTVEQALEIRDNKIKIGVDNQESL